jgi:hypothetical protein
MAAGSGVCARALQDHAGSNMSESTLIAPTVIASNLHAAMRGTEETSLPAARKWFVHAPYPTNQLIAVNRMHVRLDLWAAAHATSVAQGATYGQIARCIAALRAPSASCEATSDTRCQV